MIIYMKLRKGYKSKTRKLDTEENNV